MRFILANSSGQQKLTVHLPSTKFLTRKYKNVWSPRRKRMSRGLEIKYVIQDKINFYFYFNKF